MGYTQIPEFICAERVDVCSYLLSFFTYASVLERIMAGDEKCISYKNVMHWSQCVGNEAALANEDLHHSKLLYFWWYAKCLVNFEHLNLNQPITEEVYFNQFECLKSKIEGKWSSVISRGRDFFHQDNPRPHHEWMAN